MATTLTSTGVQFPDGSTRTAAIPLNYMQRAIFGYGRTGTSTFTHYRTTNVVSNVGIVATDISSPAVSRSYLAAAGYGYIRAIFAFGATGSAGVTYNNNTNLVGDRGEVDSDVSGIGTARANLAGASYGLDRGILAYGFTGSNQSISNLVSNTGVVATNTTGVGTARSKLAAAGYGGDKAIFGYGANTYSGSTPIEVTGVTNLVSNIGVVAADVTGVGTFRMELAAAGYGGDKAIFGYGIQFGSALNMTNLVSNTGVVATDVTGVGTARYGLAAASYGGDKAIFGYGATGVAPAALSITNLVSNTGVVATNTTGVGQERYGLAAASYGS
jgi:hypothetical protein